MTRPMLVAGARALVKPDRDLWPYPWLFPGPASEPVNQQSLVAAPANAVLTELLAYQVPDSYRFRLSALLLTYVGVAVSDAPQLVTWNVDVDIPTVITGPLTKPVMPSGYRLKDFGVQNFHLGSIDVGPYPVYGRLEIDQQHTLRVKVTTTAPFPAVGSPVFFVTQIAGWVYPV